MDCLNAYCTEIIPLLYVCPTLKPKGFLEKTREEPDLEYFSSQEAQMMPTIFFYSLLCFETYIASTNLASKVTLLL